MNDNFESQIHDAVRLALLEKTQADHESRINTLERFRWWLLSSVAIGSLCSAGTLALVLLEGHR